MSKPHALAALLLAVPALLFAPAAQAGGYALPNTNARDEGMAGSAVANQTGPEAAFANGAALAGLEGLAASASGTAILFRSSWSDPLGRFPSASTESPVALPPNLNLAYGFKWRNHPLAVGLALAVPGGGDVYWNASWPGRATVLSVDRRLTSLDLVAAGQPLPELKLSLGAAVWFGTEHLKQALVFNTGADGLLDLGTSGHALSWSAAAEVKPLKDLPLKIGLQYKHKADLALTGSAHFAGVPDAFRPQLLDQGVSHALTFPNVFHAGVAYEPIRALSLQAALSFWRFVVYRQDLFAGDRGVTVTIPFHYRNAMTYRLGAEWGGILPQLKVRAGILRDVTPQPTDSLSPGLPESSRWAVSAGASWEVTPAISATLATEYAIFDGVTATGANIFPGSYETRANLITLGAAWRMK